MIVTVEHTVPSLISLHGWYLCCLLESRQAWQTQEGATDESLQGLTKSVEGNCLGEREPEPNLRSSQN